MPSAGALAVRPRPQDQIYSFGPAKRDLLAEDGLRRLLANSPDLAVTWAPDVAEPPQELMDRANALARRRSPALAQHLGDVVWHAWFEHAQRLEDELAFKNYQEQFEPDTGLYKKAAWVSEVKRFADNVAEHGGAGAVLILDLDGLKRINDNKRLGHVAADDLIARLLDRLARRSRGSSSVKASRTGGDEFSVLLSFLPKDNPVLHDGRGLEEERRYQVDLTDEQRAEAFMNNLFADFEEEFERPVTLKDGTQGLPRDHVPILGVSGGYAIIRQGVTGIQAVKGAEDKMYEQKEESARRVLTRFRCHGRSLY